MQTSKADCAISGCNISSNHNPASLDLRTTATENRGHLKATTTVNDKILIVTLCNPLVNASGLANQDLKSGTTSAQHHWLCIKGMADMNGQHSQHQRQEQDSRKNISTVPTRLLQTACYGRSLQKLICECFPWFRIHMFLLSCHGWASTA